jgi:hypothetical protein
MTTHISAGLHKFILSRVCVNNRRGLDWIMYLLTTYAHDWELQAITAPSLMSTLDRLLLHTHCCSQSVTISTRRFLITASNSGDSSALTTPRYRPRIKPRLSTILPLFGVNSLPRKRVYRAVASKRVRSTRLSLAVIA